MGLAVVRDLREVRAPAGPEEIERFETDVVAGFVLARAAAGLSDSTIRGDVSHLEQVRSWFGRPLWDMAPGDADAYFGKVLRAAPSGTRLARAQAEGELAPPVNTDTLATLCLTVLSGLSIQAHDGLPQQALFDAIDAFVSTLPFTSAPAAKAKSRAKN